MKYFLPTIFAILLGLPYFGSCVTLTNQPDELISENGLLEVTLNVGLVESLHGIPWSTTKSRIAPGYNGAPQGPTLRVKPGDTLRVTLNNQLAPSSAHDLELRDYVTDPTSDPLNLTIISNRLDEIGNINNPAYGYWGLDMVNLHFHGMEFPPMEEDINMFLAGGESRTYTFQIPEDQEPGLNWYHDHVHGTSTNAYLSGLFGFIVVEGTENDITNAPGVDEATEVFMMLSEGLVRPDGTPMPSFPPFFNFDWTSVTNGHLPEATTYNFEEGDVALFRIASATAEPTINLRLPDHEFVLLAHDGTPLPALIETDVITVGGGGRKEFLVRFDKPGTYIMTRDAWTAGFTDANICEAVIGVPVYPCFSFDKKQDVATIIVAPKSTVDVATVAENPITVPVPLIDTVELPTISDRLASLAEQEPVGAREITLDVTTSFPFFQIPYDGPFVPPGIGFGINKKFYTPFQSAGEIVAGTCEIWNVVSDPPGAEHAFHTHSGHFRVLEEDGVPVEDPFWVDTWPVFGSSMKIHVCTDRLEPGDDFIFHCHMPNHMDIGMAAFLTVIRPDIDPTDAPVASPTDAPSVDSPTDAPSTSAASIFRFETATLSFLVSMVFGLVTFIW